MSTSSCYDNDDTMMEQGEIIEESSQADPSHKSKTSSSGGIISGGLSAPPTPTSVLSSVLLILLLGVATTTAFVWIGVAYEQDKQQDSFQQVADDSIRKLTAAFGDYVTAASMVHNRCRHRNFTRQDFRETYEYLIASGLSFKAVQFDPNVTHAERAEREAEAAAYYAQHYPHVNYQGFRGFNTLDSTTVEPRIEQPFYFPIHYMEPVVGNEAAIDLDYHSSESRIRAVQAVFDTKGPSLTDRLSLVRQAGSVSRCGDHGGPSYGVVLMHPGVPLSNPQPTDMIWPRDFSSIVLCVPDLIRRSAVDNELSQSTKFVYIHDQSQPQSEPVFMGGARVESGESLKITFLEEVKLEDLDAKYIHRENIAAANRVWTISVLADEGAYQPDFLFVLLGGSIIFVASLCLSIWVYTNARRTLQYNRVLAQAEQSTAIVTSLFPKSVARQMMEQQALTSQQQTKSNRISVGARLKDYDANERQGAAAEEIKSKPIADLFPECTVLFADMQGFTAWSSIRDPASVFHLLETIYSTFDAIADKRGVFKVETVGDSYVAVCGLPEKRKDHAVVMSRFANDCCRRLPSVLSRLEVDLGPETSSLNFRFGLHSGPVTGGVLRGQRTRFQLFGDTVNMTSRIEGTGIKGKIHISQATANLLRNAGKGHWVVNRQDQVFAKGVGMIETCWLVMPSGTASSGRGTNSDTSSNGGSENGDSWGDTHVDKHAKLVDWHTETLAKFLKVIIAQRMTSKATKHRINEAALIRKEEGITRLQTMPIDQMSGTLSFPFVDDFDKIHELAEMVDLGEEVMYQLRSFVQGIDAIYHHNPFHNFEHASHVVMSVVKLLTSMTTLEHPEETLDDPLARFTLVLASVIHDVDHPGVPNSQLIAEEATVAVGYKGRSVAEQNSLTIAWGLLMRDEHKALRRTIYQTESDLVRFREYLVHAVLLTDIVNKDLQTKRKERWNKVFGTSDDEEQAPDPPSMIIPDEAKHNTRKTALLELVIQASDVSHTMQHWHIFRQWNKNLFLETYKAFQAGRGGDQNPLDGWFQSEIGFFKFYVIPLAERVKQSRACGHLGEELYLYACSNVQEWEMKEEEMFRDLQELIPKESSGM